MATYLQSLLGEDEFKKTQQSAQNMGLLQAGLAGLMASGPSLTPTSAGQVLGAAGLSGLSGYQDAMSEAERQGLQGMEMRDAESQKARQDEFNKSLAGVYSPNGQINYQALQTIITRFPDLASEAVSSIKAGAKPVVAPKAPETFTLKSGESRYVMGPDGTPQLVASAPKEQGTVIDASTDAYMQMKYGTKDFVKLSPEAQQDVLRYKDAPDAAKAAELSIAAEQAGFNMPGGVKTQVPQGKGSFITPTVNQPQQGGLPSQPSVREQLTGTPKFFGMGAEQLSKPLGEKEVPLIQSQGISAANKEKLELDRPAQTGSMEYTIDNIRQMRNSAAQVYNHPAMQSAFGFGGASLSSIPGTGAADVKALVDTLKNQSFVTGLQNMRNANPTGGGVGNVSNAEGGRFENLFQNLEQAQSPEAMEKALLALIKEMELSEGRIKNAYKRTYGEVPDLTLRNYVKPEKKSSAKTGKPRRPLSEILGK